MNLFGIKLLTFCDMDTMYVFIYGILVQCFKICNYYMGNELKEML